MTVVEPVEDTTAAAEVVEETAETQNPVVEAEPEVEVETETAAEVEPKASEAKPK